MTFMQTKIKVCVTFLDTAIHIPKSNIHTMLGTVLHISKKFLSRFIQLDKFTEQVNLCKKSKWNIQLINFEETVHNRSMKMHACV